MTRNAALPASIHAPGQPGASRRASVSSNTGLTREVVAAGLRHDLPLMGLLCQGLASGGLPQAGLLAEHTYVITDALRQLLSYDEAVHGSVPAGLDLEQAAVTAQLCEVAKRTRRLYSAERPGGLDSLDWHLARLWVLTEDYLTWPGWPDTDRAAASGCRPEGSSPAWRQDWFGSLGHHRRARLLAWLATSSGVDLRSLVRSQPVLTRAWIYAGVARRARSRARRLWGNSLLP